MSKHTLEPWCQSGKDSVVAESDQLNNGEYILECFGPDRKANARRIVACVNACAGMSNDELEGGLLLGVMEKRIAELEQQRNNLTDTCARLIGTIAAIGAICNEAIDEKSNAATVVIGLAKATNDILSEIQGVKK